MRMDRITPSPGWQQVVIVRLFRRWSAARSSDRNAMASTAALAQQLGETAMFGIALHSLLQLVEGHLGRALEPECCCSSRFSPDETALLELIAAAPAPGQGVDPRTIPHGLPGALAWAAASLKQLMPGGALSSRTPPRKCPFGGAAG